MNDPRGATFEAFGTETKAEKNLTRRVVYVLLTKRCAVRGNGGRYSLTNKGRRQLDEIVNAKKVAS